MAQDGPKMAPRWPKMAPGSPPMAQDGPKMAPRWPQDGPKMAPRRPQDGPKMAPRWLLRACLGQSRAILGLIGAILGQGAPRIKNICFFRSKSTSDAWGSSVVRPRWTLIQKKQTRASTARKHDQAHPAVPHHIR